MSQACNCPVCGEWDDGHDNHHCQGSPSDRLYDLESRVSEIEDEYISKTHLVELLRNLAKARDGSVPSSMQAAIWIRLADEIEKC